MAQCKECGGDLVKKKNKAGDLFLVCEDCGKKYKLKAAAPKEEEEEAPAPAPVVEEKPAAKKCKACGGELKKKKSAKTGDIFLVCEDCGKKYKLPTPAPAKEEDEEEEEAPAPAPVVEEKPAAKKCKACGGELKKKKSAKTGDIFLVCEECGKKYKLPAPAPVVEKEEEEEEEAPVIPAPAVEELVIPAPVVEETPVVPAPVVEEAPVAASNDELASIAKSLQEINKTLKAMLTILNR